MCLDRSVTYRPTYSPYFFNKSYCSVEHERKSDNSLCNPTALDINSGIIVVCVVTVGLDANGWLKWLMRFERTDLELFLRYDE